MPPNRHKIQSASYPLVSLSAAALSRFWDDESPPKAQYALAARTISPAAQYAAPCAWGLTHSSKSSVPAKSISSVEPDIHTMSVSDRN